VIGATIALLVALFGMLAASGDDRTAIGITTRESKPAATKTPKEVVEAAAVRKAQERLKFVARGGDNRKEIALTFDDGPTPFTPKILKVLERYGAHATFFQYGVQVDEHPELTYKMARMQGIEIGNHTQLHPRLDKLSKREQQENIIGGAQTIIDVGGTAPHLFRPPYGATNADTYSILDKVHQLSVMWSIDSRDYTRPGVRAIVDGVVRNAHPGAIVLMHDGVTQREQTVAALPQILSRLKERGYKFVTVSELLVDNPPPALSEEAVPKGAPGAG
jgi:peptidoglycan/xylan/chitin deacetylase (PgdA/CDA1 family)